METITIPIKEYEELVKRSYQMNFSEAEAIVSDKDFIRKILIVSEFIKNSSEYSVNEKQSEYVGKKMTINEYRNEIEHTRKQVAEGKYMTLDDFLNTKNDD